ncbi:hypothetical protein Pelo_5535 [Pelomyxa schiedti]|nr:hypothetical protein Pelo_5535 [Pelomyxa schiedti]
MTNRTGLIYTFLTVTIPALQTPIVEPQPTIPFAAHRASGVYCWPGVSHNPPRGLQHDTVPRPLRTLRGHARPPVLRPGTPGTMTPRHHSFSSLFIVFLLCM